MTKAKSFLTLLAFLLFVALSFIILNRIIPRTSPQANKSDFLVNQKVISYVALGDSLTEGIGDTTGQGGFIPLLSADLEEKYQVDVQAKNYGVSGNTSQQILGRIDSNKNLEKDLKKADIVTITVGGNDLLAVIREHLNNLETSTFILPSVSYQGRLRQMISRIKETNKDCPILVLGIYNPFYLNFPEMTAMQDVVDNWNKGTQAVTKEYQQVYFVPINDRLYKGINGQGGIDGAKEASVVINDALFEGDHFHPNNTGYQIMADAVMEILDKYDKQIKH